MLLVELFNREIKGDVIHDDHRGLKISTKVDNELITFLAMKTRLHAYQAPEELADVDKSNVWDISFSVVNDDLIRPGHAYKMTNSFKQFKVLPFIINCIKELDKKPGHKILTFEASSNEPSKISAYERLARTLGTKYEFFKQHLRLDIVEFFLVDSELLKK